MPALFSAAVAQLVERNLAKVEVESSRLFCRSSFLKESQAFLVVVDAMISVRRDSKAVMHRIANPCRSVRLRLAPPVIPAVSVCVKNSESALKNARLMPGIFFVSLYQGIAHVIWAVRQHCRRTI